MLNMTKFTSPTLTSVEELDVSGNSLLNAPEWKLNFGATYVVPVQEHGFFSIRADATWTDDKFFDQFEDKSLFQEAYWLYNASIRYETAGGHWSLEIYGKNLADEEYHNFKQVSTTYQDVVSQAAPGSALGIQLVYTY